MHGDVRDERFVLHAVGGPVLVGVEDELRPSVDGPVAGRDDLGPHGFDLLQVGRILLPEGHHDFGVVALG